MADLQSIADREAVHITVVDIRTAQQQYGGFCISGIKAVCEQHGLDFNKVVRGYYTVGDAKHINDSRIHQLVVLALKREGF
jgi:hypothetical protein